jgi:hypothetical protein
MKTVLFLFAYVAIAGLSGPLTAREYYEELKASGALANWKYACFDDRESPNFKVMLKVSDVIAEATQSGDKETVQAMHGRENDLVFQPYNKGIAAGLQTFEQDPSDSSAYSQTVQSPIKAKMTYTFNWATLRYRFIMFSTGKHVPPPLDITGKCELIRPE